MLIVSQEACLAEMRNRDAHDAASSPVHPPISNLANLIKARAAISAHCNFSNFVWAGGGQCVRR
jgi:hypothetical protein